MWYWKHIGGERCPIVDTWWQTETGGILISPLPGITTAKPGSATRPLPGISAAVVDDHGRPVEPGRGGYLVITAPWPGMFRTLYKDDERYVSTYFSRFGERVYFPGDGARQDEDGDFWLLGRVDDVMNVSGHRLSTIELESTLVEHPAVAEAAATAAPDALTGQTPLCFVVLRSGHEPSRAAGIGAPRVDRPEDRQDRPAEGGDHRRRPAEDTLRQDHAAAAQGHRRGAAAGRYHDASRPDRRRGAETACGRGAGADDLTTTLLLVRHAEPEPPRPGGGEQNDRRLSDTGRTAAAALAAELSAEPIAAIYSSPYPRARETVEPLASTVGLPVAVLDDLRERLLSPGVLDDWLGALRRSFADPDYALPGGESSRQAGERVGALWPGSPAATAARRSSVPATATCWRWRSGSAILRSASSSGAACRCRRCTGWLCVERPVVPSSRGG